MAGLKSAYVGTVRVATAGARATGLLQLLERHSANRTARWARSLFAIYDIDDMVGLDLPWWTFDAIDQVDDFLRKRGGARVFEYGSGASTIWLGKRAGEVVSIEHDDTWFPVVQSKLPNTANVRHRLVPADPVRQDDGRYGSTKPGWSDRSFRSYVHAIDDETGDFDVIVIDGRGRVACLEHAASRLATGGMIVFDNSNRPPYRAAIERSGLRYRELSGLAACLPYPDATTLLNR